jgi:hypothetical protein
MKKNSVLILLSTSLFVIGIIAFLIAIRHPGLAALRWLMLSVSLAYLLGGWYLFRGYCPEGDLPWLLLSGFLYASVFMSFTMRASGWPLSGTFVYIGPLWAVAQLIVTVLTRKKMSGEGFVQFLIEGGLMLILTLINLFRN